MTSLNQSMQLITWLIALIQLIVGLYVLLLNAQDSANRYVSAFLFILAANTYGLGSLTGAANFVQAKFATVLLAATSPMLQAFLLITCLALLKPGWAQRKWRWIPILLVIFPLAITLADILFGTKFWYLGLNPNTYFGGYVSIVLYTGGSLGPAVLALNFAAAFLAVMVLLFYVAIFDRSAMRFTKRFAWLLFSSNLVSMLVIVTNAIPRLQNSAWGLLATLFTSTLYAIVFANAAFQGGISEQRLQRGSIQVHLTGLVLIVSLPLLAGMSIFLTNQARVELERGAIQDLTTTNSSISDTANLWLDLNSSALQNLTRNTDIVSMDPARQTPLVKSMADSYFHMYLVSTVNLDGVNVVRSDNNPLANYSDSFWFQQARDGAALTSQIVTGLTGDQPSLVMSMPILNERNAIVGVGMFASDLNEFSRLMVIAKPGHSGASFIIDTKNQLVAFSGLGQMSFMQDVSSYAPVKALREGPGGLVSFRDESGQIWRASVSQLPNGWGIVAQEPESELFAPIRDYQRTGIIVLIAGALLLLAISWSAIHQSMQPVKELTETAGAISSGDLTRLAPVEGQAEFGLLAEAFNKMTTQLRELIGNLESRVAERTHDLEHRVLQLQVTAEVAREASAIHGLDELLNDTVRLISDRFGYYHAGIFFTSEQTETGMGYALLQAASSEGGQRMLKRQHKLNFGQGIVGTVAVTGQPRIALDVGADAVYFNNPDLPLTHSEMALPLKMQNRVIGVLDVQSTEISAFHEEDIAILQILADQITLAIENARLLSESQKAFHELEEMYGSQIRRGWQKNLAGKPLAFALDARGITHLTELGNLTAEEDRNPEVGYSIQVPIELRGQQLGTLRLRRDKKEGPWTQQEINLLRETVSRLGLALDNTRLMGEAQRSASREQQINWITAQVRSASSVESILKNTVRELGKSLGTAHAYIQIGSDDGQDSPAGQGADEPR